MDVWIVEDDALYETSHHVQGVFSTVEKAKAAFPAIWHRDDETDSWWTLNLALYRQTVDEVPADLGVPSDSTKSQSALCLRHRPPGLAHPPLELGQPGRQADHGR